MSFPVRTLSGVCEISTASFLINSMPKAHEGESGAIDVVVQFKYQGQSYIVDSLKAEMYLLYQSQDMMTDAVNLNVEGDTARGNMPEEFMTRAGCPLLVIKLTDPTTGQQIVACHVPVHVDNVLGSMVITTRPPTPSEVVYVGRAPYIENGNWYTFDTKTSSFIDTGVGARGPQGPAGPAGGVTGIRIGGETYEPNETGVVTLTAEDVGAVTQPTGEETPGEAPLINAGTFGGMTVGQFVEMIYPVGSIYISASATSPSTLFGGTWESIGGRFLLGADATYAAGSTGGEATHELTISEIPKHIHNINASYSNIGSSSSVNGKLLAGDNDNGWLWDFTSTGETGGNAAHNNMPPYLAVYMWQRTA